MLTSITPLGERGRAQKYAVTVTAYVVGSVAGGALSGVLLGLLGSALPDLSATTVLAAAAVVLLLAAAVDGPLATRCLPIGGRQVNEDWLGRYRGWVYGVGFGFQLGLGAVTIITSAAVPAVAVLAVLTQSPAAGLAIGVAFGLARAVPVFAVSGVREPDQLRRAAARWTELYRPAARSVAALLAVAGVASGAFAVAGVA